MSDLLPFAGFLLSAAGLMLLVTVAYLEAAG